MQTGVGVGGSHPTPESPWRGPSRWRGAAAYADLVRWSEPAVWREQPRGATLDAATLSLSGLDQLKAMSSPPGLYHLTGSTFENAQPREAEFSMPITGWLRSSQGAVPGGMLAVPGDGALGCAIHTELTQDYSYTTAEISFTYLRPLRVGTRVHARGRAQHVGRRLAFSTCDITDDAGRLVAYGTSRCSVFDNAASPLRGGNATPPPTPADGDPATTDVDPFEREPAGVVLDQSVWDTNSGLDVLRGQIAGTLPAPPLHHILGIAPVAAAEGSAECVMPLTAWLNTPWGWPQGGFVAVLADTAVAMAVQTTVPAGTAFASVDLKVNYLRPIAATGGLLHARASVVHRGRSLAVATAELTDANGRRVALATGSAQILPGRPAALTSSRD